jgi:hypothetical protein
MQFVLVLDLFDGFNGSETRQSENLCFSDVGRALFEDSGAIC